MGDDADEFQEDEDELKEDDEQIEPEELLDSDSNDSDINVASSRKGKAKIISKKHKERRDKGMKLTSNSLAVIVTHMFQTTF